MTHLPSRSADLDLDANANGTHDRGLPPQMHNAANA
jgi:hypothetical protein